MSELYFAFTDCCSCGKLCRREFFEFNRHLRSDLSFHAFSCFQNFLLLSMKRFFLLSFPLRMKFLQHSLKLTGRIIFSNTSEKSCTDILNTSGKKRFLWWIKVTWMRDITRNKWCFLSIPLPKNAARRPRKDSSRWAFKPIFIYTIVSMTSKMVSGWKKNILKTVKIVLKNELVTLCSLHLAVQQGILNKCLQHNRLK